MLDQAQSNGDNAIVAINPATKVKQDARQTIEAKAPQQEQINSNNKATTEEKKKHSIKLIRISKMH